MKVTRTSDKFYMQFPPKLKKNPPMCMHIHTRTHTIHTHCTHLHILPALCSVMLSNSFIHLALLSCQDLLQLDKLLSSYDTRKKCSAWLPECPGGLLVCLFFSHSGRSSRVQRCSSTRDKPPRPWHPAAPQAVPCSRHSCRGGERQQSLQDNVKKAKHTHTHPPIQIIK